MLFLNELKQATADLHQQTEEKLYASQIMDGTLLLSEYKHLLLTHFQFHGALENELEKRNFGAETFDLESRRKLPALRKDLQEMNISEPEVADLFTDWSDEQLLGACYVAEGSTLGGKVIEKHLRKSAELKSVPQFYFYGIYGEHTGEKWKVFSQFLAAQGSQHPRQVVQGACDAFRLFQVSAEHAQLSA